MCGTPKTLIPLVKGQKLIFFDEVQERGEIVTAIKFLVEEGCFRYVLSGSLFEIEIRNFRSVPVVFLNVKEKIPLDFEKFCRVAN